MAQNVFNAMQLDAIGEIMNISLGSSATAVSNLLDHRVDITTPRVRVVPVSAFNPGELEPSIGVEVKYVSGLEGSNIMLLKRHDVKAIVELLMGMEIPDEEFELNELSLSAVCELMNQMMGAASTALADFLGRPVNISTPVSFTLDSLEEFKKERYPNPNELLVAVHFMLDIDEVMKSEFVNLMSIELVRELLECFGMGEIDEAEQTSAQEQPQAAEAPAESAPGGGSLSQEEIEAMMGGGSAPVPGSVPPPTVGGGSLSQEEIEALMGGAPAPQPQVQAAPVQEQPAPQQPAPQQPVQEQAAPQQPAPQTAEQAPQGVAQQPVAGQMPQGMVQPPMAGQMPQGMMQPPMAGQMPQGMMQPPMQGQPPYGYGYGYGYPQQPPMGQPVQQPQVEPRVINSQPVELPKLMAEQMLPAEQKENLDLIMSVPLQVSVEIGRTKRKVEEILTFAKGSLVVLDKLAGDQVDIFVNGLCVARGDVVVIDDNFGVRITEVVQKPNFFQEF